MKILLINPPSKNIIASIMPKDLGESLDFLPPLGLIYIAGYILKHTKHEIKILLKNKLSQEPACLYLHTFDFLDKVPEIKIPKFKKFIKYYNTKNTWRKLKYIISNYRCVSVKNYYANRNFKFIR